jgi:prepilin-type N-terminal cleavage/methylation domain-containing protein
VRRGFTLIELLIVVAIIAILAAIAVPNFLEAQTRAKVSRVKNDLRALTTGIESYRVDNNSYPDGTDSDQGYDNRITDFLAQYGLQKGYYGFRTRNGATLTVGRDFAGITTPIAYMTTTPTDVFAGQAAGFLTYCYRPAKTAKNGYVLTSVGPDTDLLAPNGKGTVNPNVIGTFSDTKAPSRLGDINEGGVTSLIENNPAAPATGADVPRMRSLLVDLSYDPTNGTVSDGDIVRVGP